MLHLNILCNIPNQATVSHFVRFVFINENNVCYIEADFVQNISQKVLFASIALVSLKYFVLYFAVSTFSIFRSRAKYVLSKGYKY